MEKVLQRERNEGYYAVASFVSIIFTLTIHYFFLSIFNLHSTIHAAMGLFIFLIFTALFSFIFSKLW